ncbi:MAG: LPS export ABC transporter periplasmic protein LptC [Pseudomonadota bacterium]
MSADTSHAMDHWVPRRQLTLAQARQRTRMVKFVRWGLVGAATITFGTLVGFVAGNAYVRANASGGTVQSEEMVVMLNPRFTGRDSDGEIYTITADSAERRRTNANLVDLINPKLTDAQASEVLAPRGLFDRESETLELFEDVLVKDKGGYVFNSTHARVLISSGRVEGMQPLVGTGPIGDVESDSYELNNEDDSVIFKGRVITKIYPDDPDPTDEEES